MSESASAPVQATTEEGGFRTIAIDDLTGATVYVVAEKVLMIKSEYDHIREERITTIFLENGSRVRTLVSAEEVVAKLQGRTTRCRHVPNHDRTMCEKCRLNWADALDEMHVAILPGDPREK